MRINEGSLSGSRVDQRHDVNPAHSPASVIRSASVTPDDASSDTTASEFVQLVSRVDETDHIRPEVIEEVSRRLAAGLYDSRDAAERAAEAILQTGVL
jgi:hypothetical protein